MGTGPLLLWLETAAWIPYSVTNSRFQFNLGPFIHCNSFGPLQFCCRCEHHQGLNDRMIGLRITLFCYKLYLRLGKQPFTTMEKKIVNGISINCDCNREHIIKRLTISCFDLVTYFIYMIKHNCILWISDGINVPEITLIQSPAI